jgi:hypothetical protein
MSILHYVQSLRNFFHKDEIVDDLRVNIKEFKDSLMPAVKTLHSYIELNPIESETVKGINTVFTRNVTSINTSANIIKDVEHSAHTIVKNAEYVKDTLQDVLATTTLSGGLTAQKAVLIRTAEQLSFFVDYLSKLLNYIYIHETNYSLVKESKDVLEVTLTKAQDNEITNGLQEFIKAFDTLASESYIESVKKIPNIVIGDATKPNLSSENPALALVNSKTVDPFNSTSLNGFIGNPIYHLRSYATTLTASRYKTLQERKKLLELRMVYLKSLNDKQPNAGIENKINKMQEYVNGLEYDIQAIKGEGE